MRRTDGGSIASGSGNLLEGVPANCFGGGVFGGDTNG